MTLEAWMTRCPFFRFLRKVELLWCRRIVQTAAATARSRSLPPTQHGSTQQNDVQKVQNLTPGHVVTCIHISCICYTYTEAPMSFTEVV